MIQSQLCFRCHRTRLLHLTASLLAGCCTAVFGDRCRTRSTLARAAIGALLALAAGCCTTCCSLLCRWVSMRVRSRLRAHALSSDLDLENGRLLPVRAPQKSRTLQLVLIIASVFVPLAPPFAAALCRGLISRNSVEIALQYKLSYGTGRPPAAPFASKPISAADKMVSSPVVLAAYASSRGFQRRLSRGARRHRRVQRLRRK